MNREHEYFQKQIDKLERELDELKEYCAKSSVNIALITEQQKRLCDALAEISLGIKENTQKIHDMEKFHNDEKYRRENNKNLMLFIMKNWHMIILSIVFASWLVSQFLPFLNHVNEGIPNG